MSCWFVSQARRDRREKETGGTQRLEAPFCTVTMCSFCYRCATYYSLQRESKRWLTSVRLTTDIFHLISRVAALMFFFFLFSNLQLIWMSMEENAGLKVWTLTVLLALDTWCLWYWEQKAINAARVSGQPNYKATNKQTGNSASLLLMSP